MRDWVANVHDTYYLLGSALGPHPYPLMVREFQSVIGREARQQIARTGGRLPDVVVACVGGGSNAIGMFDGFIDDPKMRLIGVEAGGERIAPGRHAARFAGGSTGVLQGTRTFILQDEAGNIELTHSISAGLDYAAVGPEHAWLRDIGRTEYGYVTDAEALEGSSCSRGAKGSCQRSNRRTPSPTPIACCPSCRTARSSSSTCRVAVTRTCRALWRRSNNDSAPGHTSAGTF